MVFDWSTMGISIQLLVTIKLFLVVFHLIFIFISIQLLVTIKHPAYAVGVAYKVFQYNYLLLLNKCFYFGKLFKWNFNTTTCYY